MKEVWGIEAVFDNKGYYTFNLKDYRKDIT